MRGIQDLRAAVRFFRKDAATTNTYRVSPAYIAAGGSSVETFMALEIRCLDKASEVPAYVGLAGLGGIEGSSGNSGYSSAVLAVLNLSGASAPPVSSRSVMRRCAACTAPPMAPCSTCRVRCHRRPALCIRPGHRKPILILLMTPCAWYCPSKPSCWLLPAA